MKGGCLYSWNKMGVVAALTRWAPVWMTWRRWGRLWCGFAIFLGRRTMKRGSNSLGHEVGYGYGLPFYHTEIVVASLFIFYIYFSFFFLHLHCTYMTKVGPLIISCYNNINKISNLSFPHELIIINRMPSTLVNYIQLNHFFLLLLISVFGIVIVVVVIIWKKLFYKKVLLIEIDLIFMYGWLKLWFRLRLNKK